MFCIRIVFPAKNMKYPMFILLTLDKSPITLNTGDSAQLNSLVS